MSVTAFKDGLDGLSITGVNRRVDVIPIDASVADLPLQYTTLPANEYSFRTFGRIQINPIRSSELVVLVRPIVMGTTEENTDDVKAMADNVVSALEAAVSNAVIDSYTLTLEPRTIHGIDYYAVIATVSGRDK